MHRYGTYLTWAISLVLGLVQGPITRAQDSDTAVFRSTSRLVQLNVVVLDKDRQPVTNLSGDDFQILDNGREQKLIHLSRTSTARSVDRNATPLAITNRPQGKSESAASKTVILVDELIDQDVLATGARAMIQSARLQILKFLGTLQPGDEVALYALRANGVVAVHDFTDDPAELVAAANTLGSGLLKSASLTSADVAQPAAVREIRDWLSGLGRKAPATHESTLRRVLAGYAFGAIAHHLEGVPGRKNVVWISPAFPSVVSGLDIKKMSEDRKAIDPLPFQMLPVPDFSRPEGHYDEMRNFARYLSSANLSIYPIDPAGLLEPLSLVGGGADRPSAAGAPPAVIPTVDPFIMGPWATMNLVASETGGRAFYDANDLAGHLRDILEENRVSYQLGYYPGDKAWDGKYHQIEIKMRNDGLTVLCRKGYFAVDVPLGNSETALHGAANSLVEGLGIGLTVAVPSNPLGWSWQDVVLKVDTHDIRFDSNNGRWNAKLQAAFVQLDNDGRVVSGVEDGLALSLSPRRFQEAAASGWSYSKRLDVKPKAEKLRIVVRDTATGAIGSVSVPIRRTEPN